MNGWIFFYLMVVLKLPIVALFAIIWWAVREPPQPAEAADGNGDSAKPRFPHPRGPLPRLPRRGPHQQEPIPAPARTRSATAPQRDHA